MNSPRHVDFDRENVLAVEVDSTERPDIPPFGNLVDYLTFGGIYREVSLRIVPQTSIENIFAQPKDVLSDHPSLDVQCFLASASNTIENGHDAWKRRSTMATGCWPKTAVELPVGEDEGNEPRTLHLDNLGKIELWD